MVPNVTFQFTPATIGIWTLVGMAFVTIVKAWPAIKARVNEARRIELDADGKFREDLLARLADLERERRDERREADRRHEECETTLRQVRAQLESVVRQFLAYQMASARAIPLAPSPEMQQALNSLEKLIDP